MQIILAPIPGPGPTSVRIEPAAITVNDVTVALRDLPATGPLRQEGETVIIEYGQEGGLATIQIGEAHEVIFLPPPESGPEFSPEPVPEPSPDPEG